jgi:SAM-dependent methyltransferase
VSRSQSKFVERPASRRRPSARQAAESAARRAAAEEREARRTTEELETQANEVAPYLARRFGLTFRGRVLELGAGAGWLSAALSRLPAVVEVIATDVTSKRLKHEAPAVFQRMGAIESKIIRMPGDPHRLDFPDNHFDFVVCTAVLNRTANVVGVLREAKRVLKPGGRFVAVREPVQPRLFKASEKPAGRELYSLADYERFFAAAGLPMESKRVNLASGMKYFFNEMLNGVTHGRYALVARKPGRSS